MKDNLKKALAVFKPKGKFSLAALKDSLKTTKAKQGAYRGGLTVLVLAVIVVINLIAAQLPENLNTRDLSEENVTQVSATTKKLLKNLDDQIVLKVLADKSTTDSTIKSFLETYAATSKNVSIEWIDPVLHPATLTKYSAASDSVVIEDKTSGDFETVAFSTILSSSYDSSYNTVTTFDGDGQLTSAINLLTNDTEHKIYLTTGHGEDSLNSDVTMLFTKANYTTADLNTLIDSAIPEDADLIMIYGATTDFTDDEIKNLEAYIAAGGHVMVVLSSEDADTPKLAAFVKAYGLAETDGYIADTQRSYQGQSYYLFPNLVGTGDYAANLSSSMVLLINTKGFTQVDPSIDNVTVTPLMQTSTSGYNVTEDKQEQGTYILGAVAVQTSKTASTADSTEASATDSTASSTTDSASATADTGKLTIISSTNLVNDSVTQAYPSLENNTLFMNMISANFDDVENISIEAKTLSSNKNTVASAGGYSLLFVLGIPLMILASGFVIWFRRKKA